MAYFHRAYQALATIPSRYPRLIIIRGTHKFRVGRKRYSDRSSTTFVVVVEITFFLESVFFFLFSVDVFPPAEAGSPTFFCCCAASCGFYAFPLCQEEEEKVCRAFQTTENLVQAKHTILYKQGSSILSGAPNNFIFDILTYF